MRTGRSLNSISGQLGENLARERRQIRCGAKGILPVSRQGCAKQSTFRLQLIQNMDVIKVPDSPEQPFEEMKVKKNKSSHSFSLSSRTEGSKVSQTTTGFR